MAKPVKPPAPVHKYRQVINILNQAKSDVLALLSAPEDEMHRIRIGTGLTNMGQHLGLTTGTDGAEVPTAQTLGPATTIGGKPLMKAVPVKKEDTNPKDEMVKVLAGKVESLYDQFLTIDSKELLLKYEDLVLRGVAKKAHLKVTKDDPEVLTLEFIEEIKASIGEINALNDKNGGQKGTAEEIDLDNMGEENDDETE